MGSLDSTAGSRIDSRPLGFGLRGELAMELD